MHSFRIPVEGANRIANVMQVIIGERHVHGDHQHAREQPVGVRKMLREAESLHLVHGLTTPLDKRADAAILQVLLKIVTLFGLDFVILVDVKVIGIGVRGRRQYDFGDALEARGVQRSQLAAAEDDAFVFLQLEVEEGRLQIIKTGIQSPAHHFASAVAAEIAQGDRMFKHFRIVGDDGASIPKTT